MPNIQVMSGWQSKGSSPVRFTAVVRIDAVVVRGVRLIQSVKGPGYFVGWPTREVGVGSFEEICYAPGAEDKAAVLAALVKAYEEDEGSPK